MTPDRERFEGLLPFYLNGTLGEQDVAFVEQFLNSDSKAQDSLQFARHLQDAIRECANDQPDSEQVARFLRKFNHRQQSKTVAPASGGAAQQAFVKLKGWWLGLVGVAVAAGAAVLVLTPSLAPTGALHGDRLDGRPDLELILAQNITPSHEEVLAHLQRFNGRIVAQFEQDGHHRIVIDLQNRAADQHDLIVALQDAGHLEGFTVLASR